MLKSLGQVAYESYVTQNKGVSPVDGSPLPSWEGLTAKQKAQWEAAAHKVARFQTDARIDRESKGK
jgi:hypothetical protein